MLTQLFFYSNPWLLAGVLVIVLGLCIELPYRFARPLMHRDEADEDAWNTLHAGILTLAAFVLGLSFSQAQQRYDLRRELVVKEANSIGSTWLRADQLSPQDAKRFRSILIDYTADRLRAYETPGEPALYVKILAKSFRSQDQMWSIASSALRANSGNAGLEHTLDALNQTIDVSAEQLQALGGHVPTAMVNLTIGLVILGALTTGFRFARDGARPLLLSVAVVCAYVIVISMSLDYDRSQTGLVTVNLAPLRIQLQTMKVAGP